VMGYNAPKLIYEPMVEFFKRHWRSEPILQATLVISCSKQQ
jgi:hypothetical protein